MGEKAKTAIIDLMKSDEMRAYFKEMMHEQTEEIVSAISFADEKRMQGDVEGLRKKLSQEKQLYGDLKQTNSELVSQNGNLQSLLDEKIKEFERMSEQYREIDKKVSTLEMQNAQLIDSLEKEKTKIEKCRITWEEEKRQMSEELNGFEKRFSGINSLHKHYASLPSSVKQRISNIFSNDNVYSMIVAVSDWNSIEGLWGFTKRRIIEDEIEGLYELVNLFSEAFYLFSMIEGNGRYELIKPNVGDRFDSDKHSIKGIKTDGTIEKVLLSGIYDSVSKKTVFKAVVQIL